MVLLCVLLLLEPLLAVATTVSTSTVSGDWNDAARWSAGVPTATLDALLAAPANAVATRIENLAASACSVVLSNANSNASLQLLNGGSLTLYGTGQIAGFGTIATGGAQSGSLSVLQTNALLASSVLNLASANVFSLAVSANNGTAYLAINSNQNFSAINCVLGNATGGSGGQLVLDGGRLSLTQWLSLGRDQNDSGTFVFNGGELGIRWGIRGGMATNAALARLVFNDGRIVSSSAEAFLRGFGSYPLVIELAGTGTHELFTAGTGPVTIEATALLADKAGEQGTLLKTGPSTLTLAGPNSYSGGTVVAAGTLKLLSGGAAGTGDIEVGAAALSLEGGLAGDHIADSATLTLSANLSSLGLGFSGTDTVHAVSLDGGASWLPAGVYGAAGLAEYGYGFYSGSGFLQVSATPGTPAVPHGETDIWDMADVRTHPVSMQVVSSSASSGLLREQVHFFVTNSAGSQDRFYACVNRPQNQAGPLPVVFMLHGGSGHASAALANVPISYLPAGAQAVAVALDYGTHHATPEELALHTRYGEPVPEGYSPHSDVNREILHRDLMAFRRILDHMVDEGIADPARVAVFGTSWGGFRTMLWAGLDDRIAAASISPGGGGMRGSPSLIGSQVAAIPEPMRGRWYEEFDPLAHAHKVAAQLYVQAPSNDRWFYPEGIQACLDAMPGLPRWAVVPNNDHGAGHAHWSEGGAQPFLMNALFGSAEWPLVDEGSFYSTGLSYQWKTFGDGIASAALCFSPGAALEQPARYWVEIPATFNGSAWTATLPERFFDVAGLVYATVADTNGFCASSRILSVGGREPQYVQCSLWQDGAIWDRAALEKSWRPIDSIAASLLPDGAPGAVRIVPDGAGAFAVANNSAVLASSYAASRQGLALVLDGKGTAGTVQVELHRNCQVPGGSVYSASVSVGAGETECILPWSAFVPQGGASGNPYPFDGVVLRGVRPGVSPLAVKALDLHETATTNGVPHWWLIEKGYGSGFEESALLDEDGDGVPLWREYVAGTDPLDDASFFRSWLSMFSPSDLRLEWGPVAAQRSYSVEFSTNLLDGFSAAAVPVDWPVDAWTSAVEHAQAYYRVRVANADDGRGGETVRPPGVAVLNPDGTGNRMMRYNDVGELVDLRVFGVNYYDAFSRYMENANDRSFVAGFDYLAAHAIPLARVHTRGYGPIGWSLYFSDKAEYYRRLDDFIAQAEQRGIGLLLDLIGGVDGPGELVDDAVAAGYLVPGVDFNPPTPLNLDMYGAPTYAEYRTDLGRADSGSNALIAYYARELVARYRNSPAVWGWEFANESNNAVDLPNVVNYRPVSNPALGYFLQRDDATVPAWTSADDLTREHVLVAKRTFARAVRAADSWRFIGSGDSRPRPSAYNNWKHHAWAVDTKAEIVQVVPMDNPVPLDTVSMHVYQPTDPYFVDDPVTIEPVTGDYEAFLAFFKQECDRLGQPLCIGEWGAKGDGSTADEKTTYHRFLQALIDTEIQLSLLWNFDNRNSGQVGEWWVNPGTAKEYQLTNDDPGLWDLEQANREYGSW